jgi:hypothetical protein
MPQKEEVGSCFHDLLIYSGVFLAMRWMMLEKAPGVAALRDQPCLDAKSLRWSIWMGWLAPYSNLGPAVFQIRGQGALPGSVLSCHVRTVGGALLGDLQPRPWMLVVILTA